jgi:predicted NAD/FAD-binding protein
MSRRRVAVIGSGVAGLTAAYVLQRDADVTLYESDFRLGGHAHTHDVIDRAGRNVAVDTGFLVHNERTYPHLIRLFGELDVATQDSEMSMSIRCDGCGLEYAGARGLAGLFPTARTATRPRYLYLLSEILRFHRLARRLLADETGGVGLGRDGDSGGGGGANRTMAEFLRDGRFSHYFRAHFATPLISAVWSCAPELALEYPARYLFEFLANHGMLSVSGSPQWRTVVGGSARYVERAAKQLTSVQTSTPVRTVERVSGGVRVRDDGDDTAAFDAAVIATHPDQALALLSRPTAAESDVLGAIAYSDNATVLHSDPSVLPRAERARASWNYSMADCRTPASAVRVTYDLNRLQRLGTETPYLVTLNGPDAIADDLVVRQMNYQHPIFTPESVAAQAGLPALNDGVLAYAGAYHGWGFHEDGCRSGVEAALSLGVRW